MLIYISTNFHSHNSSWGLTATVMTHRYSNMLSLQFSRFLHFSDEACARCCGACVYSCRCVSLVILLLLINISSSISVLLRQGDGTIQAPWQNDSVQQHCDSSWPPQDNNVFVCVCVSVCFWERPFISKGLCMTLCFPLWQCIFVKVLQRSCPLLPILYSTICATTVCVWVNGFVCVCVLEGKWVREKKESERCGCVWEILCLIVILDYSLIKKCLTMKQFHTEDPKYVHSPNAELH